MSKKDLSKNQSRRKRRRKKRHRRVLLIIEIVVILLAIAFASIMFMPNSKAFMVRTFTGCPAGRMILKTLYKNNYDANVYENDAKNIRTVNLGNGYTNIALMGIDPRDGEFDDSTHSDTIMIVSINNKTHDVKLVSVYRDSFLKMKGEKSKKAIYEKANYAYFIGGVSSTINMLNENFDLDITEYAIVNFEGLADIIDALGGVDISITDAERDLINGYLVETREITGMDAPDVKKTGKVHLSGLQATAYCRIRYTEFTDSDGNVYHNDYGRTARQRYILNTVLEKAKTAGVSQLLDVADTIIKKNNSNGRKIIATNIKWNRMVELLTVAVDCNLNSTFGFPYDTYTPEKGKTYFGYVIPQGLKQNVVRLHKDLFPDKTYTPSSVIDDINDYIINETGVEEPDDKKDADNTDKKSKSYEDD